MGAFNRYREALRIPGIARVVAAAFLCRLLAGMVSLALLLAAVEAGGGYASAGAVTAAYAVALTIAAPVWGRRADRLGLSRSLVTGVTLQLLAFAAFVAAVLLLPEPPLLVAAAFLVGSVNPPSGAVTGTVFTTYVTGAQARRTLLALNGLMTEGVFIVGPMLVGALVAVLSPLAAVVATAVVSTVGALWLATAPAVRATGHARSPVPTAESPQLSVRLSVRRFGWPAGQAGILAAVALAAAGIGAVNVTAVAHATQIGASAGLLLGLMAVGGVLSSFLYGGLRLPGTLPAQLTTVLTLYGASILLLGLNLGLAATLATLFVIGFANGPADAMESEIVAERAAEGSRTQAFGWLVSANWIGFAAGTSLTGYVIERAGTPGPGAIVGAAASVLAAAVALIRPRTTVPAATPEPHTP
ncbi:MFS transporter [Nonomuraea sp. NPDC049709]|uniref:MFS transporter n=1 Tax=Nonomuraea sp. NPDC049709 TaxID=3154736 RepID=UPI00343F6355